MQLDPFREFERLTEQMHRGGGVLAMDAIRGEQDVTVYLDVPGVDPSDLDITVEKNEVTITAERRWSDDGDQRVISSERPQGTFTRRLVLSDTLDMDRLDAHTSNGVLTINIPVSEQSKPRKIEVQSRDSGNEAIEATAQDSKSQDAGNGD
jgi:HSP20 family protein